MQSTTLSDRGVLSLPKVERELLRMVLEDENVDIFTLGLSPQDFTVPDYGRIFELCLAAGRRVDYVTIYDLCVAEGIPNALDEVIDRATFSACTARDYAERILAASRRRALIALCGDTARAASSAEEDEAQLIDRLRMALDRLETSGVSSQAAGVRAGFDAMNAELFGERAIKPVPTGFPALDQVLNGGLRGSALVLLGGLTSVGKSLWTLSIATHAAQQGHRVLLLSTEMTAAEVFGRLSVMEAYSPFECCLTTGDINRGQLSDVEREKLQEAQERAADLLEGNLFVLGGRLTTQALRREALRMKHEGGLGLVVVDYLQQMATGDARTDREEYTRVSGVSWSLKALAVELSCPVLAAVQYSREANKSERPQIHHLRGSGTLEQDANIILTLHRPASVGERDADAIRFSGYCKEHRLRYLQLFVDKNRSGRTGDVLHFAQDGAHMQIFDARSLQEGGNHLV